MSKSLQEQLVQAGLASTEQAERKPRQGKKRHKGHRGKSARKKHSKPGHNTGANATQARAPEHAPDAAGREPVSNRQRKRERAAQVEAVIAAHGLQRAQGEVPYRFARGGRIKETWVSPAERDALARGDVALIGLRGRYALLPIEHVGKVREINPAAVLVAIEPGSGDASEDDHPVPDDLVW